MNDTIPARLWAVEENMPAGLEGEQIGPSLRLRPMQGVAASLRAWARNRSTTRRAAAGLSLAMWARISRRSAWALSVMVSLAHILWLRLLLAQELGEDRLAIMDPTCLEVSQTSVNVPKEGGTLLLVGPLGANQRPHVVARAGELALGHALFDVVFERLRQRTWIEIVLMLDMPVFMGVRFRAMSSRTSRHNCSRYSAESSSAGQPLEQELLEELLVVLIGSVAVHSHPADLPARSKACQRP